MADNSITVNTSLMAHTEHTADLCIIGGGLSGVSAAIAAARRGTKVLLMQDRPMLGGNASSEIRMWVRGAKGLHNRETGIISELEEENIYRNHELTYSVWDSVIWGKVMAETNIELLLNCSCVDAKTEGDKIVSVTGWQLTTYTWHTVKATLFSDCSGDSILATLSGARWRVGREGHDEFGETIGPVNGDKKTMGMSCLLQARETDAPVKFIPPDWAYVFEKDGDFDFPNGDAAADQCAKELLKKSTACHRDHMLATSGVNFWWLELGGEDDSIHDTEKLRDELLKIAYGIWDHIKNRGDHNADNWELEWVGFLPGKRESRRYVGAHVLTQGDIEGGGVFDDVVAYGGWPMDDHNPGGFRAPAGQSSSLLHPAPSPYGIPYRSLYSTDVKNLFFAGRNISATHAAISSTRVMATCALLGQAVGEAAAICTEKKASPAEVGEKYISMLQKRLLDDGCMLPGLHREIPELTLSAKIDLPEAELELLQNGIERPDENMNRNYAELPVGGSLTFDFDKAEKLNTLRLLFDLDYSRKSVSPNKKMKVFAQRCNRGADFAGVKVADTLVKAFYVECDGKRVFSTNNCYHSLVKIPLNTSAKQVKVVFTETWGAEKVHLFSADID